MSHHQHSARKDKTKPGKSFTAFLLTSPVLAGMILVSPAAVAQTVDTSTAEGFG